MVYCDIEWFALETNRDHSDVFEIPSKYRISDPFVDYDGYSISSKGFLPTVVDIMVIQVYALTSNAEETEVEQFYEYLQDLLELTHKKRCPFHHRGLKCKSRKSRDTWSNRQVWP